MTITKQHTLTPQVRFSEFKEEWEFINGNELFKTISNKKHDSDLPILAISQEFGAIPRHLINYNISVTANSVSSYKVVDVGDFIISLRSFQGGIEYSNYKGICSPAYIILRPTVEIEADFFKSHFKSYRYIQQLQSKLEGIRDGKMVSYKYFSEIKLPFPSLPEQKKIAHFFSIIDKKLNQLQEKLSGLEHYKKGMMQQIFSQKLRFKDANGQDFPDWEKLKFPINIIAGNAYELKNYVKEGIILIQGVNIGLGKLNFDKPLYIHEKNKKTHITLFKGDILLGLNRPITNGQLKVCRYNLEEKGYLYQRAGKLDYNEEEINSSFLYQFLRSDSFLRKVQVELVGSDQPYLKSNLFKVAKLIFPSKQEQTKIANFLSKIDDKINTVNAQIKTTKTYKKGLLQKMFV